MSRIVSRTSSKNHVNLGALYEDGSIDLFEVQRNARRLRNEAIRDSLSGMAHAIAQFVRDHRPYGTPVQG